MPNSPYTSQSAPATYNASPPSDDGSAVASNQIDWSKIKGKLGDPVKTFIESVNSALVTAFGKVPNLDPDEQNQFQGVVAFSSSELTIASGSVTATRTHHSIDTESDAATDDLDSIAITSVPDGAVFTLRQENASRAVTLKHGTGNIFLLRGSDYTFPDAKTPVLLQRIGNDVYEIGTKVSRDIVQEVLTESAVVNTSNTTTSVLDDTIPQNTEGNEFTELNTAITPKNTSNKLVVEVYAFYSFNVNDAAMVGALFQDATVNAIAAHTQTHTKANQGEVFHLKHEMTAGTTSETTFKFRLGTPTAGDVTFNGENGARVLGGVVKSFIRVTEFTA